MPIDISSLVEHYGYWAVCAGSLLEGETVLLAAGYAAHRGWLRWPEVVLVAFAASAAGDQISYWLGRRHGERLFTAHPAVARQAGRIRPLLQRHPNAAILSLRFLYGLRTAGPAALGALGVPPLRFALFNLLGAAIWATGVAGLGYQFGNALQWLLHDLHAIEEVVLLAVLAAGLGWTIHRHRRGGRR